MIFSHFLIKCIMFIPENTLNASLHVTSFKFVTPGDLVVFSIEAFFCQIHQHLINFLAESWACVKMVSTRVILSISICSFYCLLYFYYIYIVEEWPGLCISCKAFYSINWISCMMEYSFQILQNSVLYMKTDGFIGSIWGQLQYVIIQPNLECHNLCHYTVFHICWIILKLCTEHGSIIAMPCSVHNFKMIQKIK